MQVAELRRRLLERVGQAAASGDEGATARVASYVRALLISMARHPSDLEVDLQELTIGTRTAALILGMHPEYVRFLIRGKGLSATKADGEFSIPLQEVVRFMETGTKVELGEEALARKIGLGATGVVRPWPPQPAQSEDEAT